MSELSMHEQWSKPDNSNLTAKQFSFRLPVHIAAKLGALCDLYPTRNRTQIVADLLDLAINEVERTLPMELGDQFGTPTTDTGETVHHLAGIRAEFRERANEVYAIYETEQGVSQPGKLYGPFLVTESMIKDAQK